MESKYVQGFMRGREKRRYVHSFINPLTSSPLAAPCPLPVRLSELLSYRLWQLTLTCQTTTTLLTGSIWPLSESTLLFPLSLPSVSPRPLYFPNSFLFSLPHLSPSCLYPSVTHIWRLSTTRWLIVTTCQLCIMTSYPIVSFNYHTVVCLDL